jgi:hypothetical protein
LGFDKKLNRVTVNRKIIKKKVTDITMITL